MHPHYMQVKPELSHTERHREQNNTSILEVYRNQQYITAGFEAPGTRLECMHLSHVAHSVLVVLVDASPLNTCNTSLQVCMDNRKHFKQHTLLPGQTVWTPLYATKLHPKLKVVMDE